MVLYQAMTFMETRCAPLLVAAVSFAAFEASERVADEPSGTREGSLSAALIASAQPLRSAPRSGANVSARFAPDSTIHPSDACMIARPEGKAGNWAHRLPSPHV